MKDAQPQTSEDSLGVFFRAEVLGRSWGNPSTDKRTPHSSSTAFGMQADRSDSLNSKSSFTSLHAPEGISPVLGKMMAKALKVAHPRDAEVILSPVAPASTTHISTFTLSVSGANAGDFGRANSSLFDSHSLRTMRNDRMSSQTTKWHAVTLTVWNSADRERAARLRRLKKKIDQSAQAHGAIDPDASALLMAAATGASQSTIHVNQSKHPNATPKAHSKRHPLRSFVSDTEEGGTDSDNIRHLHRGKYQRMSAAHDIELGEAATGAFDQGEETFWIPYALTLGEVKDSMRKLGLMPARSLQISFVRPHARSFEAGLGSLFQGRQGALHVSARVVKINRLLIRCSQSNAALLELPCQTPRRVDHAPLRTRQSTRHRAVHRYARRL